MSTLLHIQVSPMGDNSISLSVAEEFIKGWKEANPDGNIIERNLATNPVPVLDGEAIFADYTPVANRPESMAAKRALRQNLIDEITGVDEIVVSTPLWNWGIPSPLKAYIDQIIIPGVLDGSGANGLAGKKVTAIIAQGGTMALGTLNLSSRPWVQPTLRSLFLNSDSLAWPQAWRTSSMPSSRPLLLRRQPRAIAPQPDVFGVAGSPDKFLVI
jgi:FMN-dependent NADH-azoreductase